MHLIEVIKHYEGASDPAHGIPHIAAVVREALLLNGGRLPLELVVTAAILHDIGREEELRTGEDHAVVGARWVREWGYGEEVVEAVREHRNSSGNPRGLLARIISDADKLVCFQVEAEAEREVAYRKARGMRGEEIVMDSYQFIRGWLPQALEKLKTVEGKRRGEDCGFYAASGKCGGLGQSTAAVPVIEGGEAGPLFYYGIPDAVFTQNYGSGGMLRTSPHGRCA